MKLNPGDWYVLNENNEPVPCDDWLTAVQWWENPNNRKVAWTQINSEVEVSTIFLPFDHSFIPRGRPQWFETMVFGGRLNHEQRRYSTWDEAKRGHDAIVAELRAHLVRTP